MILPDDDNSLVLQAQGGSHDAYRELVSRYKNYIYALITRQVLDYQLAEELAQDVFVKAYKGLKNFKGEAAFKTWITRIALNTTHSYFRSRRFANHRVTVSLEDETGPDSITHDPDPIFRRELLLSFQLCYGKLKEEMQQVISLCGFQEEQYEAVAELLAVPVGTVRSRLNRARITIKECLERQGVVL